MIWVLTAYAIIYYIIGQHDGEGPIEGLDYHKAVGFSILIPLAMRIYWRATNPKPKHPENMRGGRYCPPASATSFCTFS